MPRDERPGRGPEDLGQVYDRLGPELYRYARVILDSATEAEDVIQDVFVDLVKHGEALPQVLDGYLFTCVRNQCMTLLRRRGRQQAEAGGPLLEPLAYTEARINERLTLESGLRSLGVAQREVVHLKVFEQRSFREIAHMVGDSINVVTSRYRGAIERLQSYFDKV